jgi:hypothetical protein
MTNQLKACFMTMFMIGGLFAQAQNSKHSIASLKGMSTLFVVVEQLPDGAMVLGLTAETIQTDVQLKLRVAGIRVVAREEGTKLPGGPYVYIALNLTNNAQAASINIELRQNARLEPNGQFVLGVTTWNVGDIISNPTAQSIRDNIKDGVDLFLNVWLSVNPKK